MTDDRALNPQRIADGRTAFHLCTDASRKEANLSCTTGSFTLRDLNLCPWTLLGSDLTAPRLPGTVAPRRVLLTAPELPQR